MIRLFLCPWMGGISQGAMEGGVNMPMDGRIDICSCNIYTSTIHGGRMPRAHGCAVAVNAHGCAGQFRSMGTVHRNAANIYNIQTQ